jgi:predicted transposase/invertase (TIGR01784 family)
METDAFFDQLLKQWPQTLFELLHLPAEQALQYRFDSVELKKSLRIDGLFLPSRSSLPVYVVEVQFRPSASFYANLFAKVFCYLEENDPVQDWRAIAIFPTRSIEPAQVESYGDLLHSKRVQRIYLDEIRTLAEPTIGLGLLQMVSIPIDEIKEFTSRFLSKAKREIADSEMQGKVLELAAELLIRRFKRLSREEIRAMFQLEDLRKTRFWQEAHEEGVDEGLGKGLERGLEKGLKKGRQEGQLAARKDIVKKCKARGMSAKAIAELMGVSIREVRRLEKEDRV